ncbi:MAG: hypothetical protein AB7S75_15205 [Desulfococcaceae bacterium]
MAKYFTWLVNEPKFIFITSLSIEESILLLKSNIGKQQFFGFINGDNEIVGKIDGNSFKIHKKHSGKKNNPIFSGNITSSNSKTIIKGCFVPNLSVLCVAVYCAAYIVASFLSIIYSFSVLIKGEAYSLHLCFGSVLSLVVIIFSASKAKYVLKSDELYLIDFFKKILKADLIEWNGQEIITKSIHCPKCGKYRDNIQLGKYKCSDCGQKFEIRHDGINLIIK